MAKKNRTCLCCESTYRYCSTCDEFRHAPSWMNSFDTDNCMSIFTICSKFNMSLISQEEAQNLLQDCDLSNQDSLRKDVRDTLAVIMAESTPVEESNVEEDSFFLFNQNAE